jgi:hypothetical protein
MTNNWFVSKLTVMFCIWGLLGIAMPAQAKPRPPFPCWTCCIDPPCVAGDDIPFRRLAGSHVATDNVMYVGQKPTKAQILGVAGALTSYANARKADGTLATIQSMVLNDLNDFYNYNNAGNGTVVYQNTAPFKNIIPANAYQTIFNGWTKAEKEVGIGLLQQYGLYGLMINAANDLTAIANGHEEHRILPPKTLAMVFVMCGGIGTFAMYAGEAFPPLELAGLALTLVGVLGGMYCAQNDGAC